nr:MAG TPA: hypothetical protein [Caudoviricetes sp.]
MSRLFIINYQARHARAFFLPFDRGLPPFDRGYTVICFTFTAYMGGFLFPFLLIRRRSPKCFQIAKINSF